MPDFFVIVPRGLEQLLQNELQQLGINDTSATNAGVAFSGTLENAYTVCLWSRLASRVLLQIGSHQATTPEELYQVARRFDWSQHLLPNGTLAVEFTGAKTHFTHSHYAALKVKDAIVDQFRDSCGERPGVDLDRPDLAVNVHASGETVEFAIDVAGDRLHKRGYRAEGGGAPLKENLAAAILLRAGWPELAKAGQTLLDPMCGSGTFVIEAALMAINQAPGLLRANRALPGWLGHDKDLWQRLVEQATAQKQIPTAMPALIASDMSAQAIATANANIERAGLGQLIHCEKRDVGAAHQLLKKQTEQGLVVANPPYGERLGQAEALRGLYQSLGTTLKQHFGGWRACVLSSNVQLKKEIGLKPQRSYKMQNGAIECELSLYQILSQEQRQQRSQNSAGKKPAPRVDPKILQGPFANRLRKKIKQMARWARKNGITCYRLYDADIPEYGVAIDIYERWVHVQEYKAPARVDEVAAQKRMDEILGCLPLLLDVPSHHVFLKLRQRQHGSAQYQRQSNQQNFVKVNEGGFQFLVNLTDYLDTGLFLDHRKTRALVQRLAAGQDFLNLFGYTGSATVYAAKGGAKSTTTVDLSNSYLEWAEQNMATNHIAGRQHKIVRDNCLDWLLQEKRKYGLIFLDPPTFSNSKKMSGSLDIQRDHVRLIRETSRLLRPNGILLFSTNFRRFQMDHVALAPLHIEELTKQTLPRDFGRLPHIHSSWQITHPK